MLRRVAPDQPVEIAYDDGLRLRVRPVDRLGKRVYLQGYSDREHAALIDALLGPGDVYFDVGANFGQFALMAGRRVGEAGQVHAFEPSGEMVRQARANVELNGLDHVVVNHVAVSDRPGTLALKVCAPGQESFNSLGTPMRGADQVAATETVRAITLDDYAAEHGIERVDLIKIDVEGAELAVVRGAARLLQLPTVSVVACEFNPATLCGMGTTPTRLAAAFIELGFGLYEFDARTRRIAAAGPIRDDGESINLLALKDTDAFIRRLRG